MQVSQSAAIDRIKRMNNPAKVAEYMDSYCGGDLLIVGINYDGESKWHTCDIEKCHVNGEVNSQVISTLQ